MISRSYVPACDEYARKLRSGDEVGDLAEIGELVNKKVSLLTGF